MIFIIGGHGFVGSAITRYCQVKGITHQAIDIDNYRDFIGQECDILINANGNSKKYLALEQPLFEFDASVRSVRATLQDFKAAQYVYLSSCDVYPDCSSPSLTQEKLKINVAQQSSYGFHKHLAELCVQHAAKNWLILRMGGFVGTGLKKNPIYDILHEKTLYVDPLSEFQYLDVDENARIIFQLLDKRIENQIYNICGRGVISLERVMRMVNKRVDVNPQSPRVRYEVSVEKLEKIISIPNTLETVDTFLAKIGNAPDSSKEALCS
jgi:nucleoside-diphosphate-sugar epimerase